MRYWICFFSTVALAVCLGPPSVSADEFGKAEGVALFLKNREALRSLSSYECRAQTSGGMGGAGKVTRKRFVYEGVKYRQESTDLIAIGDQSDMEIIMVFDGSESKVWHGSADHMATSSRSGEAPLTLFEGLFERGVNGSRLSDFQTDDFLLAESREIVQSELVGLDGHACRKIMRSWSDGRHLSQWLSIELSGFPLRTEQHHQDGRVTLEYTVEEYERLDLEGRAYAFPIQLVQKAAYESLMGSPPRVTTVDRTSLKVNQPIDPGEFRLDHLTPNSHFNADTGEMVDIQVGIVLDANQDPVTPKHDPNSVDHPQAGISGMTWFMLLNGLAIIVLGVYWGMKQWGGSSRADAG